MDKMEFTRENFVSLYTSHLALEAQVDILRSALFGLAATLEMPNAAFAENMKTEFYDCWGELLSKRFAFHIPPEWAKTQYDKESSLHLKRIHDLLLDAEQGR